MMRRVGDPEGFRDNQALPHLGVAGGRFSQISSAGGANREQLQFGGDAVPLAVGGPVDRAALFARLAMAGVRWETVSQPQDRSNLEELAVELVKCQVAERDIAGILQPAVDASQAGATADVVRNSGIEEAFRLVDLYSREKGKAEGRYIAQACRTYLPPKVYAAAERYEKFSELGPYQADRNQMIRENVAKVIKLATAILFGIPFLIFTWPVAVVLVFIMLRHHSLAEKLKQGSLLGCLFAYYPGLVLGFIPRLLVAGLARITVTPILQWRADKLCSEFGGAQLLPEPQEELVPPGPFAMFDLRKERRAKALAEFLSLGGRRRADNRQALEILHEMNRPVLAAERRIELLGQLEALKAKGNGIARQALAKVEEEPGVQMAIARRIISKKADLPKSRGKPRRSGRGWIARRRSR